ncbi:CRISPR-associated protein Cas4 [Methylocaldum gracile subsp. desertum]|uniref:CRISPR-associated protein Cas4 n=1 Tax=Methylocaldum sp. GT1BW TaxID=3438964 RepID=UPI003DA113F3
MSEPDELISISALQHYSYCPRQCALIHQEQTFTENVFTVRGRFVHERVDEPETRTEGDREIQTSVPLVSERLGLIGKSDVVEVLPDGSLYPVEYKHGPRRNREHDDIQVAAQAICLEEMTGKRIAEGVIYHHGSRRRRIVPITPELRAKVEEITKSVRALLQSGEMPPPADDPALCRGCSLKDACQPELVKSGKRIRQLTDTLFEPEEDAV